MTLSIENWIVIEEPKQLTVQELWRYLDRSELGEQKLVMVFHEFTQDVLTGKSLGRGILTDCLAWDEFIDLRATDCSGLGKLTALIHGTHEHTCTDLVEKSQKFYDQDRRVGMALGPLRIGGSKLVKINWDDSFCELHIAKY